MGEAAVAKVERTAFDAFVDMSIMFMKEYALPRDGETSYHFFGPLDDHATRVKLESYLKRDGALLSDEDFRWAAYHALDTFMSEMAGKAYDANKVETLANEATTIGRSGKLSRPRALGPQLI